MKFLCDVHISLKFSKFLSLKGFETIHINNILNSWFTKDKDICNFADQNNYILITKDLDFKNTHFINNTPQKVIRVVLGNISNNELIEIFDKILIQLQEYEQNNKFFYLEIKKNENGETLLMFI